MLPVRLAAPGHTAGNRTASVGSSSRRGRIPAWGGGRDEEGERRGGQGGPETRDAKPSTRNEGAAAAAAWPRGLAVVGWVSGRGGPLMPEGPACPPHAKAGSARQATKPSRGEHCTSGDYGAKRGAKQLHSLSYRLRARPLRRPPTRNADADEQSAAQRASLRTGMSRRVRAGRVELAPEFPGRGSRTAVAGAAAGGWAAADAGRRYRRGKGGCGGKGQQQRGGPPQP